MQSLTLRSTNGNQALVLVYVAPDPSVPMHMSLLIKIYKLKVDFIFLLPNIPAVLVVMHCHPLKPHDSHQKTTLKYILPGGTQIQEMFMSL